MTKLFIRIACYFQRFWPECYHKKNLTPKHQNEARIWNQSSKFYPVPPFYWAALVLTTVVWMGCSRSTEVTGIAIERTNQPVFFDSNEMSNHSASPSAVIDAVHPNGLDLSFLHNDHFGIFLVQMAPLLDLVSQNETATDTLENWLAELVGSSNAKAGSIERIFLLLDRDAFDLMQVGQTPVVWIFEYRDPLDSSVLPANRKSVNDLETTETPLECLLLTPTRLAAGPADLLKKLSIKRNPSAALMDRIDRLEVESDVSGLVVIEPIQGTLEELFGIFARFGDEAKLISELPEQIKSLCFQLSARGDTTLSASVEMKSDRFAKDSFSMFNNMLSMADGLGSAAGLPMTDTNNVDVPIQLQVTEVLEEVASQISSESLFDVKLAENFLKVSLKRPGSLDRLVKSMSQDFLAGQSLERRQKNLEQLAEAMAAYEKKHGHLPPAASADEDQSLKNNWRIALLPYLNQQELYDQFDLEAAWNSAPNLEVAKRIPEVYKSLTDLDRTEKLTAEIDGIEVPASRWHLVYGSNSVYRADRQQPSLAEVEDQKTRTAIVIEGGQSTAVPWTAPQNAEPEDWSDDEFGEPWENGVLVIDANFKPRMVKRKMEYLQTLISSELTDSIPRNAFFRQ